MDTTALKNYILADAELAALAGEAGDGTYPNSKDGTIAQTLNARTASSSKAIPVQDAYLYLLKNLKWRGIEAAASDPSHLATNAAYTAIKLVTATNMLVDFLDPVSGGLMAGMVATSLISADDKLALEALSTTTTTEGEKLFGQRIGGSDVAKAFGRGV